MAYDVIIIGGGVVGCAVARELSRFALLILLLEKQSDICMGASKANTAIVHAGFDAAPGSEKARFNVLGNAMFDILCQELNVPFRRNGSLVAAFDGEEAGLNALLERGRENGVPDLALLSREELRRREPHIGKNVTQALFAPTGGIVCPFRLTLALAQNAAANGVEFELNADVVSISHNTECHNIECNNIENADSWNVKTRDGRTFAAKLIVNCAGVESGRINNMVSKNEIQILPRRGEYYLTDSNFKGTFNSTIFQTPNKMGKGIVVTETVDGNMLLGPTSDDLDPSNAWDTRTTAEGLKKVLEGASLICHNIPTKNFITSFSGIRARSNSGDFIIGEVETNIIKYAAAKIVDNSENIKNAPSTNSPAFFNAAGIESPGLTSAPAIAAHLATLIAQKINPKINNNFTPNRPTPKPFNACTTSERRALIAQNPAHGRIVCRCELVTEAEIREAIRAPLGARNLDALKRRVRAGAGRCQSAFCSPRALEILSEELGVSPLKVTKSCIGGFVLAGRLFGSGADEYVEGAALKLPPKGCIPLESP